jgi:ParB family transcriptional regulator, chromosome partitioning protein
VDSNEWYTPAAPWLELARQLFNGTIDLDPASCTAAQTVVRATVWYDRDADGLSRPWRGHVWCNPPLSPRLVSLFARKAIIEHASGRAREILFLVNAASADTMWFQMLAARFPFLLSRGRIQFWHPGRPGQHGRYGQALFYLGPNVARFTALFGHLGTVVQAIETAPKQVEDCQLFLTSGA